MTQLAPISEDAKLAEGFNVLREWADRMVAQLAAMPDEHIIETARNANEMEAQAFRVRGACAAEMKRRVRERAMGDEASIGKAMSQLALDIGVHFHTLKDDCRIFEEFGAECLSTNIHPREVYRLALTASNPRAAAEMYTNRKEQDARYSTLDYRRDISELNRGRTSVGAAPPDLHRLYFDLPGKAITALKFICERLQCDDEEAVSRALVYSARALEDGNDL
jgi:hypothetical protein